MSLKITRYQEHAMKISLLVRVFLKGTVKQIEKERINDPLRFSKVSSKSCIPTFYNFAVKFTVKFTIFLESSLLFTVPVVFSVYKQKFTGQ